MVIMSPSQTPSDLAALWQDKLWERDLEHKELNTWWMVTENLFLFDFIVEVKEHY